MLPFISLALIAPVAILKVVVDSPTLCHILLSTSNSSDISPAFNAAVEFSVVILISLMILPGLFIFDATLIIMC